MRPLPKICIYYRDIFGPDRAAPGEAKAVARALSGMARVTAVGRKQESDEKIEGLRCLPYKGLKQLLKILRSQRKDGIDALILQAPLTGESLKVAILCAVLRIPLVIQDFGQITETALKRKLFTQQPDIRHLEGSEVSIERFRLSLDLSHVKSNLRKRIALLILRFIDRTSIIAWLVFSDFSKQQLKILLGVEEGKCIRFPWPAVPPIADLKEGHWYHEYSNSTADFNFVFWSRLDFWMKGVDRMINGFAAACDKSAEFKNSAKLYLIGPSYQGGGELSLRLIEERSLSDQVVWVKPGEYEAGSLKPLQDADCSVLLSRWDGFPRALRESLGLGVSVLASPETHFADVLDKFNCGCTTTDPDDPTSVGAAMIKAFRTKGNTELKKNCINAFQSLSSERLATEVVTNLSRYTVQNFD
jgi:glycosyltransferase involved in cell wall biosynthesis